LFPPKRGQGGRQLLAPGFSRGKPRCPGFRFCLHYSLENPAASQRSKPAPRRKLAYRDKASSAMLINHTKQFIIAPYFNPRRIYMADNISSLSEQELAELIANASKQLEHKRGSKKRETIAKIKDLATSIGVQVEIIDAGNKASRAGSKVAVKYRDPANAKHVWTGRGMKPRWLRSLLESGRAIEEFLV
jgi:DNA-binding protein H-NS